MKRVTLIPAVLACAVGAAALQDAFARGRAYHPSLGRFMQRDVLGYVDGMSLYQYGGSNPIVRTDPTGGCSADPQTFANNNCYCVQRVSLNGKTIPANESPAKTALAELQVTISGYWKQPPEGQCGGMPKLEWWEWFTVRPNPKYYENLATKQWHEMYDIVVNEYGDDDHPLFREITPANGVQKDTYVLTDRPGAHNAGRTVTEQDTWFYVCAYSTPNCGCPQQGPTCVAAHHTYTMAGGGLGGAPANDLDPRPQVIPNPPGYPPPRSGQ